MLHCRWLLVAQLLMKARLLTFTSLHIGNMLDACGLFKGSLKYSYKKMFRMHICLCSCCLSTVVQLSGAAASS